MTGTKKRVAWWRGLQRLGACADAVEYAKTHRTFSVAWKACQRCDWMLWLIGRTTKSEPWSNARKPLVAAAVDCARLALPHAGKWREEIARDLDTLAAWTRGEADAEKAKEARESLRRTWQSAAGDAAAAAVYAAAAAAAAADAAAAAYAAAARSRVLAKCADIVRRHFPTPPRLEKMR